MDKELAAALLLHQQGFIDAAKKSYQTVLQNNPQELEALVLLAMLFIQENDPRNALNYFLQAEKCAPQHPQVQVHLANTYKLLAQREESLRHYQQALTLKPDYAEAHHNLANLYAQLQNNEEAIKHYKKAIELKPDYAAAYSHLALLYFKQNNKLNAKNYFKIVHNIDMHNVLACYHLGNFSLEENLLREAVQYYEQGLESDAEYIPILTNLAATYLKMGNKDKAIALYKQILTVDADDAVTHMNLAAIYLLDKNDRLAIKHYSLVLQLDEANFNAHFNLGVIFMDKEEYDMACAHFQTAVALLPENAEAHYNYATCLLKQNLMQTALYHLQQAVKYEPNNEIFNFRLAAVSGETSPPRPPAQYIQTLFDRYAERFDKDLLESLHYKAPDLLCALLKEPLQQIEETYTHSISSCDATCAQTSSGVYEQVHEQRGKHTTKSQLERRRVCIVDMGCGTGLCGERLQASGAELIGIDLSPGMLAIAKNKKIYHELIEGDLLDILSTRPFIVDILIAADVFIYFGDLSLLLELAFTRAKANGWLAFSCEEGMDDDTFHLTTTGRYQHPKAYMLKVLAATGWHLTCDERVILREQRGQPVIGRVYLCQKLR